MPSDNNNTDDFQPPEPGAVTDPGSTAPQPTVTPPENDVISSTVTPSPPEASISSTPLPTNNTSIHPNS